jgi:hypothetical protein
MDYPVDTSDAMPAEPPLSYDDTVTYDEQVPVGGSLADRIGRNKVYLLSESAAPRASKVRAPV